MCSANVWKGERGPDWARLEFPVYQPALVLTASHTKAHTERPLRCLPDLPLKPWIAALMPASLTGLAWQCHRHSWQNNPACWLLPGADQSTCELPTTSKPWQHPVKSSKPDRVEQHWLLMGEKVNQKIQLQCSLAPREAITACTCSDICLCVFTYLRYESLSIIWFHFECGVRRSDYGVNCCVTSHCTCMKNHCLKWSINCPFPSLPPSPLSCHAVISFLSLFLNLSSSVWQQSPLDFISHHSQPISPETLQEQ